jgi:hypothetical protein
MENLTSKQIRKYDHLPSFNDLEVCVANWKTGPTNDTISWDDFASHQEELKKKDHAWTDRWLGWKNCEYTLVNLQNWKIEGDMVSSMQTLG